MNFTGNPVHSKLRERRLSAGATASYLNTRPAPQTGSGRIHCSVELLHPGRVPRIAGPR
jgi:hypothetical protein